MPSLQIRELPENIYYLLQENAKKKHRSLAGEAIVTLAKGLSTPISPKARRAQLLENISNNPCINKKTTNIDPVDFIRKDRER
jgi:hypothetical protein